MSREREQEPQGFRGEGVPLFILVVGGVTLTLVGFALWDDITNPKPPLPPYLPNRQPNEQYLEDLSFQPLNEVQNPITEPDIEPHISVTQSVTFPDLYQSQQSQELDVNNPPQLFIPEGYNTIRDGPISILTKIYDKESNHPSKVYAILVDWAKVKLVNMLNKPKTAKDQYDVFRKDYGKNSCVINSVPYETKSFEPFHPMATNGEIVADGTDGSVGVESWMVASEGRVDTIDHTPDNTFNALRSTYENATIIPLEGDTRGRKVAKKDEKKEENATRHTNYTGYVSIADGSYGVFIIATNTTPKNIEDKLQEWGEFYFLDGGGSTMALCKFSGEESFSFNIKSRKVPGFIGFVEIEN